MGFFNAIGDALSTGFKGAAAGAIGGGLFGGIPGMLFGAAAGGVGGAAFGGLRGLLTPDYGAMMQVPAPYYPQTSMYGGYSMPPALFGNPVGNIAAGFGTGMMMGAGFELMTHGMGGFGYPSYGLGYGGFGGGFGYGGFGGGFDGNPFTCW